jgi:prepilin-type N-terminal cleavage/methylation domain-containing protein
MFKNKGFSLVELLLVVAIAAGIFAFSAPFGMNFYRTQLLGDVQSNLIDALQRARHNAVLQKNDSNFGVHIESGSYTLFQTPDLTYDNRVSAQDEVFPVINNITFSGPTDIIFSKLTGAPNATGTVAIAYDIITKGIIVDSSGGISKNDSVVLAGGGTSGCVATGGDVIDTTSVPGYTIHKFTTVGTSDFTVTSGSCDVEVLVVAGGGGGGGGGSTWANGGGGGAGGLISSSSYPVSSQNYTVTVGTGGTGGIGYSPSTGQNGGSSVFNNLTAIGGAGAPGWTGSAPTVGGSGAGGAGYTSTTNIATGGTTNQGNSGGNGVNTASNVGNGGGGGGAGGAGANSSGTSGGNGGAGLPYSISGSSVYYAGGGGGGSGTASGGGSGGSTVGGAGGSTTQNGYNGVDNTGSGGGGAGASGTGGASNGGKGGSGIVIVRYPTAN